MEFLKRLGKYNDIMLASGLVFVLLFLLVPIPAFLIDIMLGLSIAGSILILITTLLIASPLELSVFPSILLITTVTRLSLNVASTKLILAKGHLGVEAAGKVICSFGKFVMQGNIVIGITVFLILTIINFIVITKGSGRIAEVAARFNLDSMPGKQMSIDAELSTGSIDEETARFKRRQLEAESTFYGAMDGANKFIRGDAVAGLIITFINLIGGIIIATIDKGMPLNKAAQAYSILTIGDGLACQVPSVIISLASGLLVTKSSMASANSFEQLGTKPRALGISAVLSGLFGLMPGLPFVPFAVMSTLFGAFAYVLAYKKTDEQSERKETAQSYEEESPYDHLKLDTIRIELGPSLICLVKNEQNIPDKIKSLRKQIASQLGFILPSIRIKDNFEIGINEYLIKIKDVEKASGSLYPGKVLVIKKDGLELPGIQVQEPTFGLAATWVSEIHRAELIGHSVLDCASVMSTHLMQVIMENITTLFSYTDAQRLVEELAKSHKKLVQDAIPEPLTIATLKQVLIRLLAEGVSIKDLPTIIESAAEAKSRDIAFIVEHVRNALADQICAKHLNAQKVLPVISISEGWEKEIEESKAILAPSRAEEFASRLSALLKTTLQAGYLPVILVSSSLRPYVKQLAAIPQIAVLGHNEVKSARQIKHLGSV
jgi:flagellar biosynthesis protein FlhA